MPNQTSDSQQIADKSQNQAELLTQAEQATVDSSIYTTIALGEGGQPILSSRYPFLSPSQLPDELGRLGDYRILKLLGEGGMGFVFLGEDPALQRMIALKVMRPEIAASPLATDRFLREGRAAASLKSDHIITIYQVGQANGVPFLAMEFLEGRPLDAWLKQQRQSIPLPYVFRIIRDTLKGLAAAHDKGLIHRDLKPANLWIDKARSRIKVLDFGLTRNVDCKEQMTVDGALLGTPAFMAPEQAQCKQIDSRADLFSVGVVMYEMLAGVNPFVRESLMGTLGAVCMETQPPVTTIRADVPKVVSDYLDRLLSKDANGRPSNAKAALLELIELERKLQSASKATPLAATSQIDSTVLPEANLRVSDHQANAGTLGDLRTLPPESKLRASNRGEVSKSRNDISDNEHRPIAKTKIADVPRKPNNTKWLLVGGLFAFFAFTLAGVTIVITNKDGTKTTIEVPDGASVEVHVGSQKSDSTKVDSSNASVNPSVEIDSEREVAEWVIRLGGLVGCDSGFIEVLEQLPKAPLKVNYVQVFAPIREEDLDRFRPLKNVSEFIINCPVSIVGLKKLATFPLAKRVDTLAISKSLLTDDDIATLMQFPQLTRIILNDAKNMTGSGFASLKGKLKLTDINISNSGLTDAVLAEICHDWPDLRSLSMISTNITDAGLKHVGELKLGALQISSCNNVTDVGIAHLEQQTDLKTFEYGWLTNKKLTGASLKSVAKMKSLLKLGAVEIRETDIRPLLALGNLAALHLHHSDLNDIGLEALSEIKSLKELQIPKTQVTVDGVKKFLSIRPDVKLESDFDVPN